jgi:hypothetical protein
MIFLRRFKCYINEQEDDQMDKQYINHKYYGIRYIKIIINPQETTHKIITYYKSKKTEYRRHTNHYQERDWISISIFDRDKYYLVNADIKRKDSYTFNITETIFHPSRKITTTRTECNDEHDKECIILKFPLIQ